MSQLVNFSVIKQKIIKTDEVLGLYLNAETQLKRLQIVHNELKAAHEAALSTNNSSKLDFERLGFNLESLQKKYNLYEEENLQLKLQVNDLEERINKQITKHQSDCQDFETTINSLKLELNLKPLVNSPKKKRDSEKSGKLLTELEAKSKKLLLEKDKLNEEILQLQENDNKWQTKFAEVINNNSNLKVELKAIKEELKLSKKQNNELSNKLFVKEMELESLQVDKAHAFCQTEDNFFCNCKQTENFDNISVCSSTDKALQDLGFENIEDLLEEATKLPPLILNEMDLESKVPEIFITPPTPVINKEQCLDEINNKINIISQFKKRKRRKRFCYDNNLLVKRKSNNILDALLTLKKSNIGFTISNDATNLPNYQLNNNLNLNSDKVKFENNYFTQKLHCLDPKCNVQSYMLLSKSKCEEEDNLLGFFDVKKETYSRNSSGLGFCNDSKPAQDIINTLEKSTNSLKSEDILETLADLVSKKISNKMIVKRKKRKIEVLEPKSEELSLKSESESELEHLFQKKECPNLLSPMSSCSPVKKCYSFNNNFTQNDLSKINGRSLSFSETTIEEDRKDVDNFMQKQPQPVNNLTPEEIIFEPPEIIEKSNCFEGDSDFEPQNSLRKEDSIWKENFEASTSNRINIIQNIVIPKTAGQKRKAFEIGSINNSFETIFKERPSKVPVNQPRILRNSLKKVRLPPAALENFSSKMEDLKLKVLERQIKVPSNNVYLDVKREPILKAKKRKLVKNLEDKPIQEEQQSVLDKIISEINKEKPPKFEEPKVSNFVQNEERCKVTMEETSFDSPQSPDPEDTEKSNFKYDSPLSANTINGLFKKLLMFSTEEKVTEEILSIFLKQKVDFICKYILLKVSTDIFDQPDSKCTTAAPLLTQTQRVFLGLMSGLERHKMPGVFECFLEQSEQKLFANCTLQEALPITRLYTAICKYRMDMNKIRRFCCDAFYFMGDNAVPLFFLILTSWIEVLPLERDSVDFPLSKVLVQLVNLKDCNQPGFNLMTLRRLLHQYYGYPMERWKNEDVFKELYTKYIKKPIRISDYAILVFFKNLPHKWVFERIEDTFKPLINEIPKENFKATVIILVGNICSQFYGEEGDFERVNNVRTWLLSLINETTPDVVKKSIYLVMERLPKLKEKSPSETVNK